MLFSLYLLWALMNKVGVNDTLGKGEARFSYSFINHVYEIWVLQVSDQALEKASTVKSIGILRFIIEQSSPLHLF